MNEIKKIRGKVWVIRDQNNKPVDNIDTDQIFHNKHLAITKIEEMGQHIFGNLDGWKDFPTKVSAGDILIVGKNFGSGSSRQQAVDGFAALGVSAIVGESFGAIYWRNAVNAAFPVLQAPNIFEEDIQSGDEIEIDFKNGKLTNTRNNKTIDITPMSKTQLDILRAGGLFEYGRK
ncbi:MAG TPA: 3-isopropylmalate dehydratase [candidate division Zixibacteria bacterium]|nr:3-isopropylmalate dehydratase [candidate division Zixibacteria bacterium]